MQPTLKTYACVVALLSASLAIPLALAGDTMPAEQQNALVAKYCAVCHNDAHLNGGLTLSHFNAANADPSLVAMLVSKIRDGGAISAAGLPRPDAATQERLLSALLTESAGARSWTVVRTLDPATQAPLLTASILREAPRAPNAPKRYAGDNGAADVFRLTVSCQVDSHEGTMQLTWAPGVPPKGKALSALVDGKTQFTYPVDEASEKMFKGATGTSGTGVVLLTARTETSGVSKLAVPLPEQTLAVGNLFQEGTLMFPFRDLPQPARQALSACFTASSANR